MPGKFAITTFSIDRYTTLEEFLAEYREIGIDILELNGRVRRHVIEALLPYIERGEIKIVSLHNFCPKPANVDDNKLRLSSLDEELRKPAIHYTINTISTAGEPGGCCH